MLLSVGQQSSPSPKCRYTPLVQRFDDDNNVQLRKKHCWSSMRCLSTKLLFVLSSFAMLVLVTIVVLHNYDNVQQKFFYKPKACPLMKTSTFQNALKQQQRGLVRVLLADGQLDVNGTWTLIPQHYNGIWKDQMNKLNVIKLQSDGEEYKYFIVFSPNFTQQVARQCTFITLGVGHTVNAERNLTQMFPECRLITADPAAMVNENLTRAIGGTFVQAAVGGETAEQQPVNFWGEDVLITKIVERKLLSQIGIVDFLNNHLGGRQNLVDLLLIDIEGAEFGILEQLTDHYDKFPVAICQLNIEVHDPTFLLEKYTHQLFFHTLDRLLRQGRFALMHTDMYTGAAPLHLFLRMFLVNVDQEACMRRFLC
uniref:Methyltransferase FkbM domain-containing protein n=1 Tax=Globodera rostochiensis TaxID=31243 RepID=A0A914HUN7_GLORO